jgi:hypothetical protein
MISIARLAEFSKPVLMTILYVRALVSDDSSKSLSYFCVAATIPGWRILHAEDPTRVVALVTSVLDHVAITHRRSQQQKFCFRDRPPPALVAYDLARAGVLNMMKQLAIIRQFSAQPTPPEPGAEP